MSDTNGTQIKVPETTNGPLVKHRYELGTIVDLEVEIYQLGDASTEVSLKGTCRLFVVGHIRDRDMTPLYILSDLPVRYPQDGVICSHSKLVYKYVATLVESGYGEESLRPTGKQVPLKDSVAQWLGAED